MQAGTTTREGDATVFRSADDLLRHLARHPQPLPLVDGVSVRYGQLPESDAHDFDLHLPDAPTPVPLPENVARLATATATRDHYRQPGRGKLDKPPHYDGEMLEFMQGARVVGVIFPEKWGGKWCLGRHDGMFGAFPTKTIEIRPPQESEMPKGGESGMSVTTRWKWQPPSAGETPWLPFAKGEVITNVQCEYANMHINTGIKLANKEQPSTRTTGVGPGRTARGRRASFPSHTLTCRHCEGRTRGRTRSGVEEASLGTGLIARPSPHPRETETPFSNRYLSRGNGH